MKIGLFDSGLGGLAILRSVVSELPEYDFEYYGDTKHLPYGDRSESEIYTLARQGMEHLFARGCALIIIACNTASAETLRRLQDEYLPQSEYHDRRILGVIIPVVEEVVDSRLERVLLVGTSRTVGSGKYHLELGKRDVTATKIEAVATPGLVPLIEADRLEEALTELRAVIDPRVGEVGGVILGCTHYTLLKEQLRERYPQLRVFSQDEIIPQKLRAYLKIHQEIDEQLTRGGRRNIYLSELRESYDPVIETFLSGTLVEE